MEELMIVYDTPVPGGKNSGVLQFYYYMIPNGK